MYMGLAHTVLGLALLVIGVAWDGFMFGIVYEFSSLDLSSGTIFYSGLFAFYVVLGLISAVAGILLVLLGNGEYRPTASEVGT